MALELTNIDHAYRPDLALKLAYKRLRFSLRDCQTNDRSNRLRDPVVENLIRVRGLPEAECNHGVLLFTSTTVHAGCDAHRDDVQRRLQCVLPSPARMRVIWRDLLDIAADPDSKTITSVGLPHRCRSDWVSA